MTQEYQLSLNEDIVWSNPINLSAPISPKNIWYVPIHNTDSQTNTQLANNKKLCLFKETKNPGGDGASYTP